LIPLNSTDAGLSGGTITFLFTDIEGSTRHWEERPAEMRVALAQHDTILRDAILSHGGQVFKTIGDAFCAAFATAPGALSAALAVQQDLEREKLCVGDHPVRVRIALHTGAVEARDGDYFGPTLNRIARLIAVGHGGQVLLSDVVSELVRDELPPHASLRFLGEHRLRDLTRPESIYQLVHPDLTENFPPLRSLDNPAYPNNLPLQLTRFIGRTTEVAEVKRLLKTTRLLTLTGSGGCGKSRLSLQVTADLLDDYPDGAWLVELAPLTDPARVLPEVAATLGVREEPGRPLLDALTAFLKSRRLLLVLDNCEHLLEGAARLAGSLLRSCAHLTILTTSRAPLGITGETTYRVPSLALPDVNDIPPVERLTQYEAIQLFVDRARFGQPNFAVTTANAPAVARICHHLDGIPLALELAAARVRSLHVDEINDRLDNRFRLLTGGNRTALPRQQTLRALIDWSYDLLNEQERTLLDRLSVFVGGWTLEAAEQVCAGDQVEEWEILDRLSDLVDKSLVHYESGPEQGTGRYRLLETVRQYALTRLSERGETAEIRQRHLRYFADYAVKAEQNQVGPDEARVLERTEAEHDNLRVALDFAAESTDPDTHLRLAGALWWFWFLHGDWSEGRERLLQALARPSGGDNTPRALALYGAGFLSILLNDWNVAPRYLEESLATARQSGDDHLTVRVLVMLSDALHGRDEARAAQLTEEAITLARTGGDRVGLARGLMKRGLTNLRQGNAAAARQSYRESLDLLRTVGSKRLIGTALTRLGRIESRVGDMDAAKPLLVEGLAYATERGDVVLRNEALMALADLALSSGDFPATREYHEDMLQDARRRGLDREIYMSLGRLAGIAYRSGDFTAANHHLREAVEAAREASNGVAHAVYQAQQAFLFTAMSRYEEARTTIDAALNELRSGRETQPENIGFLAGEAFTLTIRGFLALETHEGDMARADFEQSISLWPHREALYAENTLNILLPEEGLGWLALNAGDIAAARQWFETARQLWTRSSMRFLRGDEERLMVGLAHVAIAEQHDSEATTLLREATTSLLSLDGMPREMAMTLAAVAALKARGSAWASVSILLGAAAAISSRAGIPQSPAQRDGLSGLARRFGTTVDRASSSEEWSSGAALSRNEALSYALTLLPKPKSAL
jgi:predicted ATPase/class 3 adenylate cyclase